MKLFERNTMVALVVAATVFIAAGGVMISSSDTMMTTRTTALEAYALQMVPVESIEGQSMLLEEALSIIENKINSTNYNPAPYITLTDEGTMSVTYNNGTILDVTDDVTFTVPHGYTPENGYRFEGNNKIIAPNGTELFG